jgi:hypothetical protein
VAIAVKTDKLSHGFYECSKETGSASAMNSPERLAMKQVAVYDKKHGVICETWKRLDCQHNLQKF